MQILLVYHIIMLPDFEAFFLNSKGGLREDIRRHPVQLRPYKGSILGGLYVRS